MEPLERLFGSAARLKLLRLFLFNDDTPFTLADAAFRTKLGKEPARKEISVLIAAGVVKKRKASGAAQYQANARASFYDALKAFMRATTTIGDSKIADSLKKSGGLRLIVLTGLFTGSIEPKVDMLIVGDRLEERAVANAVHSLEAELGRELRYAAFSTEDFRYRVGVYDRLLRDVFDYPHRAILDKIGLKD